jgi:hypothetical protein
LPNSIKYSASAQTLALKKGNFWIGTGDVGKGPTSTTDYYNGITPPSGGYTIYLNKASGGPSIYCPANDAALISLTNSIAGASYTTAAQCLTYFAGQTDKMVFNIDYPAIVTNGLVLNLDAGFTPSYPTTATTWYDVSSGGNNGTLTNGPTFNSGSGGSIVLDGTNDYISLGITPTNLRIGTGDFTINTWVKLTTQTINPGDASYRIIIGNKNAPAAAAGYSLVWNNQFNKFLHATANGSTWAQAFSTNTWASLYDVWANVVMIRQNGSTNNGCFYINNVYEPIASTLTVLDVTSNTAMNMGNTSDLYGQYWTKITYGTTQIYNRALTAQEVLQNYNAQKSKFGL